MQARQVHCMGTSHVVT